MPKVVFPAGGGGGGGGGGWTDDGTVVRLTTSTDQVGIGTALPAAGRKVEILTTGVNQGLRTTGLLASDNALDARVSGDAVPRLQVLANGAFAWSDGAAPADAKLARVGTGTLGYEGATRHSIIPIADLPLGGAIGLAAATVDIGTIFQATQTTAGQTLTLPAPTDVVPGRVVLLVNTGTTSFTFMGATLFPGTGAQAEWTGVAWALTASGVSVPVNAFIQGGNSFGAAAVLGTNDAFSLSFETSGTTRMTITTADEVVPRADLAGVIGTDALRWDRVRARLIVAGDLCFDDDGCPYCSRPFVVGDRIQLEARASEPDTTGRRITFTIPVHAHCQKEN